MNDIVKITLNSSSQIGCKRRAGLELGNNLKSDEGKEYLLPGNQNLTW